MLRLLRWPPEKNTHTDTYIRYTIHCRGSGHGGETLHVQLCAQDGFGRWRMHRLRHVLSFPFPSCLLPRRFRHCSGLLSLNDSLTLTRTLNLVPALFQVLSVMSPKLIRENGGNYDATRRPGMAASYRKTGKHSNSKASRASSEAGFSLHSGASVFRVKNAFRIGRRGGPNTPMPTWKVHGAAPIPINRKEQRLLSNDAVHDHGHDHHDEHRRHHVSQSHISARKLAASLWELQGLPFSKGGATRTPRVCMRMEQTHILADSNNQSKSANQHMRPLVQPFSPVSTLSSSSRGARHGMQQLRIASVGSHEGEGADLKIHAASATHRNPVLKIKAISSKLDAGRQVPTNELVRLLNHMWNLEEQHVRNMSVVGALRAEVDQARSQLKDLSLRENALSKEVEHATRKIVEERAMWQEQKENCIREALLSIRQELDAERKSKLKLEGLHKKVMKELREERRKVGKVVEELEKERRARELMEDVCDELAREVGEDKARVEELKRESIKVREEVEEERRMLQMAEVWREERVQMKLMDAKLELEEKNTALDRLRNELEMFVKAKRDSNIKEDSMSIQHSYGHSRDASGCQSFADFSHPIEQKVPASLGQRSLDSFGNGSSKTHTLHDEFEGKGSEDEDELHSPKLYTKVFMMPEGKEDQQHCPQTCDPICNGRKPVEERSQTTTKAPHGAVQGLQHPMSNNQEDHRGGGEAGVEREGLYDHLQVSQWIECSFEGGEMKEWADMEQRDPGQPAREESIRSWQDRNVFLPEAVSSSPKIHEWTEGHEVESRKPQSKCGPLGDRKEVIFSKDQLDCLHQMLHFETGQLNPMLGNGHGGFNRTSSTIHECNKLGFSAEHGTESSRGFLDKARASFLRRRG